MSEENVWLDKRDDPFAKVTADAIINIDNGLTSTDLAVFCSVCSFLHNSTRKGHPSIKTLSSRARVSERTAKRSLKRLEDSGYIEVERRFKDGRQLSNNYHASDKYKEIYGEGDVGDTGRDAPVTRGGGLV